MIGQGSSEVVELPLEYFYHAFPTIRVLRVRTRYAPRYAESDDKPTYLWDQGVGRLHDALKQHGIVVFTLVISLATRVPQCQFEDTCLTRASASRLSFHIHRWPRVVRRTRTLRPSLLDYVEPRVSRQPREHQSPRRIGQPSMPTI